MKKRFICLLLIAFMIVLSLVSCKEENECEHNWGKWYTPHSSTCTKQGYTERRCLKCGYSEVQLLPVDDNVHFWVGATCCAPKTCMMCEKAEGELGSHIYDNGVCAFCGERNKET